MGKKLSIGITSIGLAANLVQAIIVWVVSSSLLAGLGAFGAGIIPALAAGGSLYLAGKVSERLIALKNGGEN
ncbi:MAG: hypothetical protein JW984_06335 [Deltaproteobacteria bacterium]|uniref:Uncharacterized protein n=1 Tax=Candidatus Zymogenus saltonus TaxID=2844893 RepID=A0A9D8KDQ9_9DELT|nr:hypothetical protein [Candidatus Zymogenus saltonus]